MEVMGAPLLLLLLLLPPALPQAGNFGVTQPEHLSAPEGGSIHIPFSFYYPWDPVTVSITWRQGHFHGPFIYNSTPLFIHGDYKGRLLLNWRKGQTNGSLQLSHLRSQDQSVYFCRIYMNTQQNGIQMWQSITGTTLTVTKIPPPLHPEKPTTGTTTQNPTTTTTTTAATINHGMDEVSVAPWSLSLGAMVGVAVACVAFITVILGLAVFLWCKRRKGRQTKAETPAREFPPNTEAKYENIGNKAHLDVSQGQDTDPKQDHKDSGIIYASLALSSLTSSGSPPSHSHHGSSQTQTLYSVLKP